MMDYLFLPRISVFSQSPGQGNVLNDLIKEICSLMRVVTEFCYVNETDCNTQEKLTQSTVVFWDTETTEVFPGFVEKVFKKNPELVQVLVSDNLDFAKKGYEFRIFRFVSKTDLKNELIECIHSIKLLFLKNAEIVQFKLVRKKINLMQNSILYFQGTGVRRVLLYVNGTQLPIEVTESLDECEQHLYNRGFLRVHRKYLVNLYYVREIAQYKVYLRDGTSLCIAQKRYSEVCRQYEVWIRGQKRESIK